MGNESISYSDLEAQQALPIDIRFKAAIKMLLEENPVSSAINYKIGDDIYHLFIFPDGNVLVSPKGDEEGYKVLYEKNEQAWDEAKRAWLYKRHENLFGSGGP